MAIAPLDLEGLAQACVDGELDAFAAAVQLGWTLTEDSRKALLHAVANTNYHRTYSYGVSAFTLAQAIGLISEAASNESGIAITEQVRSLRLGKEIAIAFRHGGQVHFGVRYASNLPLTPGHMWPELKPWYKVLERNRARLERWVESAEGNVAVPVVARVIGDEQPGGAELLAAIIAEPDDVERRLVYADWLVGQGDVQGELIQLEEQRRALGRADEALDARIQRLNRDYGERIAGEITQLASRYVIRRGFVTGIEMSAPRFAKHGERLLASQPIEQLDLKPVNAKALARLAKAPAVRGLRALYLSQIIGKTRPMPFEDLCRSPWFEALRRLEVSTWETDGDPLDAFASWQAPSLGRIRLYEVDSAARILAGLARSEVVRPRHVHISSRTRQEWSTGALAAPAFARLRTLELQTDGEQVGELFEGASLPELQVLAVEDEFPVGRLALPSLRRLRLERIDARALGELLERHPRLEALQVWELDDSEIDRALECALALPDEHPLAALALPTRAADPELVARAKQRFTRDFYDSEFE